MAQLSNVRFRALSATNTIVTDAGLFIYEQGSTSTFASIYTDAALTTPASNPLTSVTGGYFPQFYIASGVTVDIYCRQTTSPSSTLLWQALSVDSVGLEDEGSFYRNFDANGRLQGRGSASKVRLEFGPPVGDNVGGAGVISGWNGTDMDTLDIGADQVTFSDNVEVTGALTATGVSDFYQLLTSGTCSAAASQEITLNQSWDSYLLVIQQFSTSAGGNVSAVLSFDGSTYKTASNDYDGQTKTIGGTTVGSNDSSAEMMVISGTQALYGEFRLSLYSEAGQESVLGGNGMIMVPTTYDTTVFMVSASTRAKNYGKAAKIKIQTSSGTMTFKYALFGVPGF